MSWRELGVLIRHLPPEAETRRSVSGETEPPWTRVEHLLAGIFDQIAVLAWQNANRGRKSPTRRPRPLPRPGIVDTQVRWGKPAPLATVRDILASSRPGADTEGPADGS